MNLHNLDEFLRLSAVISYQLNAGDTGLENVAIIVSGPHRLSDEQQAVLLSTLRYLREAYGPARRNLGPLSVLHPIRAAALLSRAQQPFSFLDLLTELLHDKFEDIRQDGIPFERWQTLEDSFHQILKQMNHQDEWFLMERLRILTRECAGETYSQHIGALVARSRKTPELIAVKLADRLDNTLDMRVAVRDPLDDIDFFEGLFRLLFVKGHSGWQQQTRHSSHVAIDGAQRLRQLYKNVVLLSVMRKHRAVLAPPDLELFQAIAEASANEAKRIVHHIFAYHLTGADKQREIISRILFPSAASGSIPELPRDPEVMLVQLFTPMLDEQDRDVRRKHLQALYLNKKMMIRAAFGLLTVCLNFLNDTSYFIEHV